MNKYSLMSDFQLELELAYMISTLKSSKPKKQINTPVMENIKKGLNEDQLKAVQNACNNCISILTGFPGTGKTFTIRSIIKEFQNSDLNGLVVCPYGRTVSVAKDSILRKDDNISINENKIDFSTIHSSLEFREGLFQKDLDSPFDVDYVIIDEAGTLGLNLAHSLFKAIDFRKTRVVIIGDTNQLPSIEYGAVLRDLINSNITHVNLTKVYRQSENSGIIYNAIRVMNGEFPVNINPLNGERFTDCEFIEMEDSKKAYFHLIRKVCTDIPIRRNCDKLRDIQIFTPGKKGEVGTLKLTEGLMYKLNDNDSKKKYMDFRIGDKVINRKNNFKLNITNGDIGFVKSVGRKGMDVDFGYGCGSRKDGIVEVDKDTIGKIQHAVALTIHLIQGGEFKCTVTPIFSDHYILLQRNLLFTALTRAKEFQVVYYNKKGLLRAIKNTDSNDRKTNLQFLIDTADEDLKNLLSGKEEMLINK